MKFIETKLKGVYIIELEPISDERGFFSRTFCVDEFEAHGLDSAITQSSISYNKYRHTLRGMHYQAGAHAENKIVGCISGAVQDVVIDIRPESSTYKEWYSLELSVFNKKLLYIPKGFAHGFLTLEKDSIITYNISERYCGDYACGIRYNDLAFGVEWYYKPAVISERDQSYSDYI